MKSLRMFGLFITLVLAVSTFATPAVAKPAAEPAILAASDKIEADLLDALAAQGSADFIVRFVEQADLSPAYSMGWDQRGEFVYDTLRTVTAASQTQAKAMLDGAGLSYQTFIAGNELYVWSGTLLAADALAALPEVDFIRATRTYQVDPIIDEEAPANPDALAWGISYTKADQFWAAFGLQGDGIKVASIDTGVQWNHPALDQSFACPGDPSNPACWADPSNICGGSACDNADHGTHTMGTMVGDDDPALTYQAGMAPNATWIACKGCESNSCSDYALNACADWILAPGGDPNNRPHVVNNSWGGGGCDTWYLGKVNAWRAAGTFPAFSAGNNGALGCSTLGSPGDYQESFASAAVDSGGNVAGFSSRGPSCFGHDPYTKPNIAAPGVAVCSSIPTDSWSCGYSGTSMASPHSAGAVALLWSCNPSLIGQMDMTFQALQNNAGAAPSGNCGAPPDGQGNYTYGYGYLDILAAGNAYCGGVDMGHLDGYVYDAQTGSPIEGATVTAVPAALAAGPDATTDPNGYYTMTLVAGTYDVTALATGYGAQTVTGIEILTDTVTSQDFYLQFQGSWMPGPAVCFDLTRFDAEFFPGDDMVYVLGGRSGTDTIGDIYQFDPSTGTCADTGANMPVPISNYNANLVNDGDDDLLCTFGGRDSAGNQTLAVQCYNPATNSASIVTNLPPAYTGYVPGAQAVVDNQVYIFGGFNPLSQPYELSRTDRYDPVSTSFTQLGNLSQARSYMFAGVVDGIIYAFGGTIFDGVSLVAQARTEKMDPAVGTWDNLGVAELPLASAEGQTFAFDSDSPFGMPGKIVLAGGGQWPGETAEALVYDVATDTYDTSFPDLINARRDHAGAFVPLCSGEVDDGLPGMWVFGGRQGTDDPPYQPPEFFPMTCIVDQPPVAGFVAEPESGCAPLTVDFTDTSSGIVDEWFWDFGDGVGSSDEPNPTYVYDLPGEYIVTLWVTNTWGSDWITGTITAFEPPAAAFSWTPETIYPDTPVQFTDESLGTVIEWLWDFGDGFTADSQNPTHVYATTGTFSVTLTVTDTNGCSDMAQQALTVEEPPIPPDAAFLAEPEAGCAPLTVQFTDTSSGVVDEWFWDFGDGVGTSFQQNPTYVYEVPGNFVVTLWVTNTWGSDWTTGTITVFQPPTAAFSWAPETIYTDTLVQFTDESLGTVVEWLWDFGDGSTSDIQNPTHIYATTGVFTVTLTVTDDNGCSDMVQQTLTVQELPPIPPEAAFLAEPEAGCAPLAVQFTDISSGVVDEWFWDFGDGVGTSDQQNPSYVYEVPGDFVVTLWVTNTWGSDWTTGTITVFELPTAAFSWTPETIYTDTPVQFTDESLGTIVEWLWDFGDGSASDIQNPTHLFATAGTFTVTLTVTDTNGCTGAFAHSLAVQEPPEAFFLHLPVLLKNF